MCTIAIIRLGMVQWLNTGGGYLSLDVIWKIKRKFNLQTRWMGQNVSIIKTNKWFTNNIDDIETYSSYPIVFMPPVIEEAL